MRIYVICPVRLATPETANIVEKYVLEREQKWGDEVFYPSRDVNQDDPTGEGIVDAEVNAIACADEVHVFWDKNSKGSHFDLGVALGLGIPVKLIHSFYEDGPEKSYEKVIRSKESAVFEPR